MSENNQKFNKVANGEPKKILLGMLPYWPAQIPPVGISCLKSYLTPRGYNVKIFDSTVNVAFKVLYDKYFAVLENTIPQNKRGNFYGIGLDVIRNHLMAHLNYKDETEYKELIQIIVSKTFFTEINDQAIKTLICFADDFYSILKDLIINYIEAEKPDVFGLSVFSGNVPASLYAFRLVKSRYPHILTVMGGGIFSDQLAENTPNHEYFLQRTVDCIDKIIIGEGEKLFYKLLQGDFPENKRVITLNDINKEVMDLSKLDIPDFTDLDLNCYPYSSGFSSRSCLYQCGFCSETVMWGKYRKKSPQQTVEEFVKLFNRDKRQLFSLSDSLLNPIINKLSVEFVQSPLAIYWDACLRACKEACDIDNVYLWRKAGFYKAWLGLESGSQKVLDLMDKKITIDLIQNSVRTLASMGIKTATLWLIGYPGETEDDFKQTLDLIEELKDDIYDAEGTPFWYFLKGQPKSGTWENQDKSMLLYPDKAAESLIIQTWILDSEPRREVIYNRLSRFIEHLNKCGIPNPYTLHDMYKADERWQKLHENAVPSIIEFKDNAKYIDECKSIKKVRRLETIKIEIGGFSF